MKQTTWAVAIALVGALLVGPIEASATGSLIVTLVPKPGSLVMSIVP